MSLIQYWELQKKKQAIEEELDKLSQTKSYQADFAFYTAVTTLMEDYAMDVADVAAVLAMAPVDSPTKPSAKLRLASKAYRRPARRYENPNTGESFVTRNPKHRRLKEWMRQYGPDVVASWGKLET